MKTPRFTLFGFRRPCESVLPTLGKLERELMNLAWRSDEISVRDVHRQLGEAVAYTTLMTTLDRLYKKGLLTRRKDGRAFVYAARYSPEELEQGIAQDVIEVLLGRGGEVEPVLACIVDAVSEHDRGLLDELDRLVKEKRRQLQD
ncbi:MAG: BlaI/MecI/CopY family transcriptional regulator [Pyrinomonadaceae bacterium]|nr:BlaI/MecI/CopY family transcriptional regulator [Pyrinomonadaceae bacterium]